MILYMRGISEVSRSQISPFFPAAEEAPDFICPSVSRVKPDFREGTLTDNSTAFPLLDHLLCSMLVAQESTADVHIVKRI